MMRHGLFDHLEIVKVKGVRDFDLMLAQEPIHFAADRQVFVEADEVDAIQILGADFTSLRQRMIGRRRQRPFPPGARGSR